MTTRTATSMVGQVARIHGDVDHLIRQLVTPYQSAPTTDRSRITGDRTNRVSNAKPLTPDTTERIDITEHLSVTRARELYGISAGPIHREHAEGRIRKRGTDGKRNYLYDHRDILDAFDRGFIAPPRAGGKNSIPVEVRDIYRARIAEGIAMLRHTRQIEEEHERIKADAEKRVTERRNGNGAQPAADAPATPGATAPPAMPPAAVTAPLNGAERPVMPAPATPPGPTPQLREELAHLTGMVSMVSDPGQRDALLAQLTRVNAAAGMTA